MHIDIPILGLANTLFKAIGNCGYPGGWVSDMPKHLALWVLYRASEDKAIL